MAEYKLEHPDKPDKKREELKGKVLHSKIRELCRWHGCKPDDHLPESREHHPFSFDENEGLSEHTAPFDAVVTILEGECEVWVAGKTCRMKEGETIIFPANVPHALSALTKFKMTLVMIKE